MKVDIPDDDPRELEFLLKFRMAEMLAEAHDQDRRLYAETERPKYCAAARLLRQIVTQQDRPRVVPLLSVGLPADHGGDRLSDHLGVTDGDPGGSATREHGQVPA